MNKIMFIKIFLLTIVFIILGIDLFTDYTLNKWIKAIGFLFLSILALIDLIKKKDWFCKLRFYDVLNKTHKMDDISEILQLHNRVKKIIMSSGFLTILFLIIIIGLGQRYKLFKDKKNNQSWVWLLKYKWFCE